MCKHSQRIIGRYTQLQIALNQNPRPYAGLMSKVTIYIGKNGNSFRFLGGATKRGWSGPESRPPPFCCSNYEIFEFLQFYLVSWSWLRFSMNIYFLILETFCGLCQSAGLCRLFSPEYANDSKKSGDHLSSAGHSRLICFSEILIFQFLKCYLSW